MNKLLIICNSPQFCGFVDETSWYQKRGRSELRKIFLEGFALSRVKGPPLKSTPPSHDLVLLVRSLKSSFLLFLLWTIRQTLLLWCPFLNAVSLPLRLVFIHPSNASAHHS